MGIWGTDQLWGTYQLVQLDTDQLVQLGTDQLVQLDSDNFGMFEFLRIAI